MIAAGHVPFQLRSAVKMKPRNRNSSQIGAITQVNAALNSSSDVPSLAPSCSRIFSFVLSSSIPAQITLKIRNTRNRPSGSSTTHSIRSRGGRSPNCQERTLRPPIRANRIAVRMKIRSCTTVSAISTPPGMCEEVISTPNAAAGRSTISPPTAASTSAPISAAGAIHGGQSGVWPARSAASARSNDSTAGGVGSPGAEGDWRLDI